MCNDGDAENARQENAGLENGGNDIVWNTVYYSAADSDAEDDDEVRIDSDSDQPQSAVSEPQSQDLCEVCLVQQRDTRLAFRASCVAQLKQQSRGCPICRIDTSMDLRLY